MSSEKRRQDGDDRRAKLVRSTARRGAAVVGTRTVAVAIEREWAKLFGLDRVRCLRNLLVQLHDALWPPSAGK